MISGLFVGIALTGYQWATSDGNVPLTHLVDFAQKSSRLSDSMEIRSNQNPVHCTKLQYIIFY